MKNTILSAACFVLMSAAGTWGQNPTAAYINPVADEAVLTELQKISRSVQTLAAGLKALAEKSEATKDGPSERQKRLMLGLEMLVKTEERVANFQKLQIELVEKLNENRGKLSQVELELRPRSIDRNFAFEGTTETPELRETRRLKLIADRTTLTALLSQIQTTLGETIESLNEAQGQAYRLRRTILPQLERELTDP